MSDSVSSRRLTWRRLRRLVGKELAETLRDRRTIVTLVLMPILVYPLLGIVFRQFFFASFEGNTVVPIIGVESRGAGNLLVTLVAEGSKELDRQSEHPEEDHAIEPPLIKEPTFGRPRVEVWDELERRVREGRLDIGVRSRDAPPGFEIVYAPESSMSLAVRSYVERRLRAASLIAERAVLRKQGITMPPSLRLTHTSVQLPPERRSVLPTLIPMILLLMTITGAVYPAIDLTAGERERGTLESLIAAPVSRLGLLLAKYAAVLTVALLTAAINLLAMTLTLYGSGLAQWLLGANGLTIGLLARTGGLLLLFAAFFSAVLLAVTSFAKSFKEAQAYLIPLMLFTLSPGLMSLSPDLKLTTLTAVTPLMNIVLLAREMFTGGVRGDAAIIVVGSTLLYAVAALAFAARIFGSDAILYGSRGTWAELFRRPRELTETAGPVGVALVVALVFAVKVNAGGWMASILPAGETSTMLVASAAMLILLFGLPPLVLCRWQRVSLRTGLGFLAPSPLAVVGAILLGATAWTLVHESIVWLSEAGVFSIGEKLRQLLGDKQQALQSVPFPIILVCLAIVPAIAEELFFRGMLFRTLLRRTGPWRAILASSLLFAAFHVVESGLMTWERLPSSLLLGMVLGIVAWRSESVWPGMLFHAVNNGILIARAYYAPQLIASGWMSNEQSHLPLWWQLTATAVGVCGLLLVRPASRSISVTESSELIA